MIEPLVAPGEEMRHKRSRPGERGDSSEMRNVTIGGGTGSHNVLVGLKKHACEITAVVAMSDSGGSSSR